MAIQTQVGVAFFVHVVYMDPPPPASGQIVVSVSNPDVALVEEDPQRPGDPAYRAIMPIKVGNYVVSAFDGVIRGSLPEMEAVTEFVPPLSLQQIILA
jgi:hypothetical protein